MRVLATAGHVDHGKSALVRALTGVDPDHLAEERRRGLTIDLSFVRFALEPDLELSLEVGSTVALVGPSGAGKSTVLNAIAGLLKPAAGRISCNDEIWFEGERRIFVPPERRRVGLVFQDYALFPHLTVRQNVEYARKHGADEYLERFGISQYAGACPVSLKDYAAAVKAQAAKVHIDRRVDLDAGVDNDLSRLISTWRGPVKLAEALPEFEAYVREVLESVPIVAHGLTGELKDDFEFLRATLRELGIPANGDDVPTVSDRSPGAPRLLRRRRAAPRTLPDREARTR